MADTANLDKELGRLNREYDAAELKKDKPEMERLRKRRGQVLLMINQARGVVK